MSTPAIEFEDVTKRYGDVTAVDGLSFAVERGEVYGFLGPNGSGKTTSINLLLDFVRPTSGTIRLLGEDVSRRSARRHVGVLPETSGMYTRLTAREHIRFVIEAKDADDDPDAVLARVGLSDAKDRRMGGFSKGMTQRVMLGAALVGSPDVLILDEPSSGLDPGGVKRMREIVSTETDRGATVFFSSHILSQVEAICDRVGILRNGRLAAENTVDALTTEGETRLVIEVDEIVSSTLETIEALDGVSEVSVEGTTLRVVCQADADGAVVNTIGESPMTLESFDTATRTLEDTYMTHTAEADE